MRCGLMAAFVGWTLSACGAGTATRPAHVVAQPLQAFQLAQVGTAHSDGGRSWQQYGARPVGTTLTINPMTLYDTGKAPLVLLGIRQAKPVSGLVFGSELVTLTPGFSGFSEYVSKGAPASAFGLHANFSPLRGFVVNPNPKAQMAGLSPTVVLTATATRSGMFHIGDWVITYRIGAVHHTVELVDDGAFCAGAKGCPSY
jgi:hypothetical protein